MKSLLIYLKDYKKESILGPLFKMIEASFELFIPLLVAAIIDTGITNNNKPYIYKMCSIMILLGIIGLVCSITAQYYAAKAAVGFSTKLRHVMFDHIQKLSFTEIDNIGTSTLITRLTSDINQVQTGVNLVLRLFLRSPFVVFGAMLMAFTISRSAAVIFLVTIILLSFIVFGIMIFSMPLYSKVQAFLDMILSITRENLSGVRVIRAFCKEEDEIKKFKEKNSALLHMQMFVGRLSSLMNPVTYIIVNAGIVALVYYGTLDVKDGSLTRGDVIALVNYMSQILVELIKMANLIITITKSLACAKRIEEMLNIKPSMHEAENALMFNNDINQNIITFDNVSFTYQGTAAEALSNISFDVKKGQTVGIIGGTGSGKSTLIHLIPRFYDVSSGGIYINGINVKEYNIDSLRKSIGLVMQKAVLFTGTIEENLRWGRKEADDEEIEYSLYTSQSKEFIDKKENGIQSFIEQGGKNLSGGQRQRLTIARAIIKKPAILILDDSSSALDYATDAALRREIQRMEEDTTVIIVSQRASSVLHADKIIVLEDGEIAGIGTHDELLRSCNIYREIYDSQNVAV